MAWNYRMGDAAMSVKTEPVRVLSAVSAFGAAVLALLALLFAWPAVTVVAVGGVWTAAISVVGATVLRSKVTPV